MDSNKREVEAKLCTLSKRISRTPNKFMKRKSPSSKKKSLSNYSALVLSPKKRLALKKRRKLPHSDYKPPAKKRLRTLSEEPIAKRELFTETNLISTNQNEENFRSAGDSYYKIIMVMIECVRDSLKVWNEPLIDMEVIDKFLSLSIDGIRLYGRLFFRKIQWIRVSNLQRYRTLFLHFDDTLLEMERMGLLTTDVMEESDVENIVHLLLSNELKDICKEYKLSTTGNRAHLIDSIFSAVRTQNSYFGNPQYFLKKRICKALGRCIKLSSGSYEAMLGAAIWYTYPFFKGDERDRLKDLISLRFLSSKGDVRFPLYTVNRTTVFANSRVFKLYKEAISIDVKLHNAVDAKLWCQAADFLTESFIKFKLIIIDEEICRDVSYLPQYLKKFTAASKYASLLYHNISVLKTRVKNQLELAVEILETLLTQSDYAVHKRGRWYLELGILYALYLKDKYMAAIVLYQGLLDPLVRGWIRYSLYEKIIKLASSKCHDMTSEMRDVMRNVRIEPLMSPPTREFNAKILTKPDGQTSSKHVVMLNTDAGFQFASVEEAALHFYRREGFNQGIHDEGGTLKSMVVACMWDIIYDDNVRPCGYFSFFHSPYQTSPLDWNTEDFYRLRKEHIDSRFSELQTKSVENLMEIIGECCENNEGVQCLVNWDLVCANNLDRCREILECLGVDVFCQIGKYLAEDWYNRHSGLPDLLIWNTETSQCLFVEVKCTDKLSMSQRVWIHNLLSFGARVELCMIAALGSLSTHYRKNYSENLSK